MSEKAGWPQTVEVELHGFAQGGDAVGRWQGRPVFARGGIPGEQVVVRLRERGKSLARGEVIEVLRPAAARLAAPGAYDPRCAGCDWQHIAYETQLAGKAEVLRDQLIYLGRFSDPAVRPPVASEPWGYRSAARLHVEEKHLGFYAPGTRRIQPIDSSPLLHPLLNQAIEALLPLLPVAGLREVALRASRADGAVFGLLSGEDRAALERCAYSWREALPALSGVALATGRGWRLISGDPYLHESIGGVRLRLSPTSFFQANVPLAEAMLDALKEALQPDQGEQLLDAYCGVGTFILPLTQATALAESIGIEEHSDAVEDGQVSARAAGVRQARFFAGKVEEVLPDIQDQGPFQLVLVDPPRRGLEQQALQAILALKARCIAYVSCHPGTLARDLRTFAELGYTLRFAQAFDFFPQTSHVESLAILDRE